MLNSFPYLLIFQKLIVFAVCVNGAQRVNAVWPYFEFIFFNDCQIVLSLALGASNLSAMYSRSCFLKLEPLLLFSQP